MSCYSAEEDTSSDLLTLARCPCSAHHLSLDISGCPAQAVGEYISVASQRDTEQADIEKERQQQAKGPEARQHELEELAEIYEQRGLSKPLAHQV